MFYGTGDFTNPARFTDAIWNKAEEIGLPLDLITADYDTPQFEFTLTFDAAVEHVDTVVLFWQIARKVAWDHAVLLSFLPKPIAGEGGSGLHVNAAVVPDQDDVGVGRDRSGGARGVKWGKLTAVNFWDYIMKSIV